MRSEGREERKSNATAVRVQAVTHKQPSFSPLMFVISAFGGNDEQLSEAGIQLKYASGVAGHNRRLRRVI